MLWQLALRKSAEIKARNADLEPALALQRQILRLLIDARAAIPDSDPGLPAAEPSQVLAKWRGGIPAMRGEPFGSSPAVDGLPAALCRLLAAGGAGESADHLGQAIARAEVDPRSLVALSLARDRKALRSSSLYHGFAPDLVWLVGELASAPLAHAYQSRLFAAPQLGGQAAGWDRGYCPCCGSWPALVEVLDGARFLRCSYCAAAWQLSRPRCVYCGAADARYVVAAADGDRHERLVELCTGCSGYTKAIVVGGLTPFPLSAIDDLGTMDLDRAALDRGYHRPELIDLDRIDPQTPSC